MRTYPRNRPQRSPTLHGEPWTAARIFYLRAAGQEDLFGVVPIRPASRGAVRDKVLADASLWPDQIIIGVISGPIQF